MTDLEPFVSVITKDLEGLQGRLQRHISTRDATTAVAVTAAGIVVGVEAATKSSIAFAIGLVLLAFFAWSNARATVHIQRTTARIRQLERLIGQYLKCLEEVGRQLEKAEERFFAELDGYRFGTERSMETISFEDLLQVTRRRWRWVLPSSLAAIPMAAGAYTFINKNSTQNCAVTTNGLVIRLPAQVHAIDHATLVVTCSDILSEERQPVRAARSRSR